MSRLRLLLLLGPLVLAHAALLGEAPAAGEVHRLRYSGQLQQRDIQGNAIPARTFTLQAWVSSTEAERTVICRVDDDDRGGLAWFERCSDASPGPGGTAAAVPHVRHLHLDRPYRIAIPGPVLSHPAELAGDSRWEATWEGRRIEFAVTGEERVGPRQCWRIEGSSNTGRSQSLRVEQGSDLLVSANLRVFIGQGERFELQLKLEQDEVLDPAAGARELQAPAALLALQHELGLSSNDSPAPLAPAQLARVEAALPGLQSAALGTSWERFVQQVTADVAAERQRGQALELLASRRVGKLAPEFVLTGADGRPLDRSGDAGQVVVLHFWDYRGSPEAPFGQVGYLDFLAGKRQSAGFRVYGIAVDQRLADPALAASARREVRQFCSQFIRVGYPVAVDDGTLLGTFGDPRPLGATLPLWVVIGRDGTVVHHKAGLYQIDPNRGLEELNAIVTQAAK